MDPNVGAFVGILMRWLHILSVITLLGGFVYARYMVAPALAALSTGDAASVSGNIVARFRPILYTALGLVLVTGLYNFLSKTSYPPHYHAVFGVKMLLVLHIFATSILYTLPNGTEAKRVRRLTGMVYSGVGIVLLSAVLRYLTLSAMGISAK